SKRSALPERGDEDGGRGKLPLLPSALSGRGVKGPPTLSLTSSLPVRENYDSGLILTTANLRRSDGGRCGAVKVDDSKWKRGNTLEL
ncbi:hypothetical protein Trydic_g10283, partial [Trypoxylus dichotomus]